MPGCVVRAAQMTASLWSISCSVDAKGAVTRQKIAALAAADAHGPNEIRHLALIKGVVDGCLGVVLLVVWAPWVGNASVDDEDRAALIHR